MTLSLYAILFAYCLISTPQSTVPHPNPPTIEPIETLETRAPRASIAGQTVYRSTE